MKKVLEIIGTRVCHGGTEAFVQSVVEKLDKTRYKVECMAIFDCENTDFEESLDKNGIKFFPLNLPVNGKIFRTDIYKPVRSFLMKKDYDVIHIHSSGTVNLSMLAAAADYNDKVKVIVHSHASGNKFSVPYRILRRLAAFFFKKHADYYCACSKEAARWKFIPDKKKRILIIRNGIDVAKFRFDKQIRDKMRHMLGLDEKTFVMGNVGRMVPSKNIQFVCRIFFELLKEIPAAVLLLVGDGEERQGLEKLVKDAGVENRVIFTGSVGNVCDYLQAMDVFVFPSFFEAFGIAPLEAQAAGLPVICSDTLPSEVKVTEKVFFLPLNAGEKVWVEQIKKSSELERKDEADSIVRNGYDIGYTVEQLSHIYG